MTGNGSRGADHRRHHSSMPASPASLLPPQPNPRRALSRAPEPSDPDQKALIDSLPLFTLAVIPKSSPDYVVCLSPFQPDDRLRLLPACRHAFHVPCIDAWIRSTPSCPLCRCRVVPPPPASTVVPPVHFPSRSKSFRVEIGVVSRRRNSIDSSDVVPSRQGRRSYLLGSSDP